MQKPRLRLARKVLNFRRNTKGKRKMFIILPNKGRLAVEHIISYEPFGATGVSIQTIAGEIQLPTLTVERLDHAITLATSNRRTQFADDIKARATALAS